MRILRWGGGQLAGYRFACPEWVSAGFGTGTIYGYVCVDEAAACVAAYLAFYMSDDAAEVIAHGVMEGYDPFVTLGRLYRRLKQHCREREIVKIEEEVIGQVEDSVENVLLREGFLTQEESGGLWKMALSGNGDAAVSYSRDAIRFVDRLSEEERESLIGLMMAADEEEDAGYRGSLIPSLCAVYWQDGRATACVFCAEYRGMIRADRIYVLPGHGDCLRSLFRYIREEAGRVRPASSALYLSKASGGACLPEEVTPVSVHVWTWIDSGMDMISFRDAELQADMAFSDSREMGELMLTRLFPFAHMLEEEGEAYDMSLDMRMLPQVMITVHGLGADYIMEVGCKAADMNQGEFTFTVRTEFAGYEDTEEAAHLCSRVNDRLERATAYWDEKGSIVLRGYAADNEFSHVDRWRKFLQDWTADCHVAGIMRTVFEGQG